MWDPLLFYVCWFSNSIGFVLATDIFIVQISVDNGGWEVLEVVGSVGSDCDGGWVHVEWDFGFIADGGQSICVRFIVLDIGADI